MNNFVFNNQTRILFGKGQIAAIADEIPENAKIQDRFAEGIMLTLIEEGPKVLKDQTDYEACAK